jgi:hypothetical protein
VLAAGVQADEGAVGAEPGVVHKHIDLAGRGVRRDAADLIGQAEVGRQGSDGDPVPSPQVLRQCFEAVG